MLKIQEILTKIKEWGIQYLPPNQEDRPRMAEPMCQSFYSHPQSEHQHMAQNEVTSLLAYTNPQIELLSSIILPPTYGTQPLEGNTASSKGEGFDKSLLPLGS